MVRRVVALVLGLLASGAAQAPVWADKPGLQSSLPLDTTPAASPPVEAPPEGLPIRYLPLIDRWNVARGLADIVPGAAYTDGGIRLRGGAPGNLAQFVDGFRFHYVQPPLPFLNQVGFQQAGYSVERADVPEGVLVLQTHQPSPALRADFDASYERLESRTTDYTNASDAFRRTVLQQQSQRVVTGTVSAPVLADRLFITGSLSHAGATRDGVADVEGILPATPEASVSDLDAGLSATLLLGAHRVQALALGDTSDRLNGGDLSLTREAQPVSHTRAGLVGLRWSARLSELVSAYLQAGVEHRRDRLESMLCLEQPAQCEQVPAVRLVFPRTLVRGNTDRLERWFQTRWQFGGGVEASLDGPGFVRHRLRLSSRLETGAFERQVKTPGGQVTEVESVPLAMTSYYSNDPRQAATSGGWASSASRSRQVLGALEDQLVLGQRLFVTPGVGVVASRLEGAGEQVLLDHTAPVFSLGLGLKISSDGSTWLRASSNRRVDPTLDRAAEALPDPQYSQRCLWDPVAQTYSLNCISSGGNTRTVGLPCSPTGRRDDGSPCVRAPRMPTVWEHTLGLRQAMASWAWFDLDSIYRRTSGLLLAGETNRIWNASGSAVKGYRNSRAQYVLDLSTEDQLSRTYRGGTAAVGVAVRGLRGFVAYTYARQEVGDTASAYQLGNREDFPFFEHDDRDETRHGVRVAGAYLFPWASFGLVCRYDSGKPGGFAVPSSANPYENYRPARGTNPGTDLNDPSDDVPIPRRPSQTRVDFQARFRPGHWLPLGMDFYVDVLNALGVLDDSAQVAAGLTEPAWVRLGTELRY